MERLSGVVVAKILNQFHFEIWAFLGLYLQKKPSQVFSLSATKWRFFIPDLFEIHSSDVSTKFERLSFENLFEGK